MKENKLRKLLWLGSFQSEEQFKSMLAFDMGEASGFASQKGLVKGIDSLLEGDQETAMDTMACSIAYPPYPIYPQKKVDRILWHRNEKSNDLSLGYLNIKYLSYLFRSKALKKEIKLWSHEESGINENYVIIYEPSVAKLNAALYLKKHNSAKVFVIIPDIPELVHPSAPMYVKLAKLYLAKKTLRLFQRVDGFILYSKHMAEYYHIPKEKWILMEGVFDTDEVFCQDFDRSEPENKEEIILMYSGALDPSRGINELLDAFSMLKDERFRLWITGKGKSDDYIRLKAEKDSRIHHYGFIPSRKEVLNLQSKADVLLHIRKTDAKSAPYCFPSKIFEYMVSGKPVISVRIPGIPEEYFDYMFPLESISTEDIFKVVDYVGKMSKYELKSRGVKARKFVFETKNPKIQAEKILSFMELLRK